MLLPWGYVGYWCGWTCWQWLKDSLPQEEAKISIEGIIRKPKRMLLVGKLLSTAIVVLAPLEALGFPYLRTSLRKIISFSTAYVWILAKRRLKVAMSTKESFEELLSPSSTSSDFFRGTQQYSKPFLFPCIHRPLNADYAKVVWAHKSFSKTKSLINSILKWFMVRIIILASV